MRFAVLYVIVVLVFAGRSHAQSQAAQSPQSAGHAASRPSGAQSQSMVQRQTPTAGQDVGHGTGDIGKGAGGAAGNLAEGTGKGAAQLVTLHPVSAAGSIGKGAGRGGKDLAVGTGKGAGKVFKGTGRAIKHIF